MKVRLLQKSLGKNRQDSFWYDGQVAVIDTDHGTYSLEACGEIRVMFEENGKDYRNGRAVEEAWDRNLTDKDLNKIGEFDGWINNNWFEVVLIPHEDNIGVLSAIGDVADTYSDGVEMLKQYAKDEVYKAELEEIKNR